MPAGPINSSPMRAAPRVTPQHGAHAPVDLRGLHGLDDVVVGSEVEALEPLGEAPRGGDEDQGDFAARPDLAADVEA